MNKSFAALSLVLAAQLGASAFAGGTLDIDVAHPGIKVSPMLYGIFFEEINRAGEGGIWAEMLQNTSFDDDHAYAKAWSAKDCAIEVSREMPMHERNPRHLKAKFRPGGSIANYGFANWHWRKPDQAAEVTPELYVAKGEKYNLSFFARTKGRVELKVAVAGPGDGNLAEGVVAVAGNDWKKYEVELEATDTSREARLVITCPDEREVNFDVFSMMPAKTWKGLGFRPDLMAMLERMRPAFVRFPGGCFVEGWCHAERNRWKDSIGPVEKRIPQRNTWGYNNTLALGFHEYLLMCEALKAEPLFVINCGQGHNNGDNRLYCVPMDEMEPFAQDALDAIEYCNGPVTSKWGALRAKAGHPEPFNLKWMEIGNENEWHPGYAERYKFMEQRILAKYPEMKLISNGMNSDFDRMPESERPWMIDPHMYDTPEAFMRNVTRFDKHEGPLQYFGEYAVTAGGGNGNMRGAVSEAAMMARGLEKNSDFVTMSSYAPLFNRKGWTGWRPDAINFDQSQAYGTPSYWVQCMFAQNRPDRILEEKLEVALPPPEPVTGGIGIGGWQTANEFKDLKVTSVDGTVLYAPKFEGGGLGQEWKERRGTWSVKDGVIVQSEECNDSRAFVFGDGWTDYDFTCKVRKTGGKEGFRVFFASKRGDFNSWNVGGWGNTRSAVEGNLFSACGSGLTVEEGRWYDLKVCVRKDSLKIYLDGEVSVDTKSRNFPQYAAGAGLDEKTGETIVKFANIHTEPVAIRVRLNGAKKGKVKARILTIQGGQLDENSFDEPEKMIPVKSTATFGANEFDYTFPACSVTVMRLK